MLALVFPCTKLDCILSRAHSFGVVKIANLMRGTPLQFSFKKSWTWFLASLCGYVGDAEETRQSLKTPSVQIKIYKNYHLSSSPY